jgi:2-keto-3-deoxy-L-rhamnonate aldolase RhmA
MRKNRLRELIKEGLPTIGTRLLSPWPGMVEIIGHTGEIDYVEFLGEYATWDLHDLDNFARASELSHMSSMMKVEQEPRSFIAQRAVGSGIQNLLFADIRTVEDAQECVRIVKPETPDSKGVHGCHMRRNVGYVLDAGSAEYARAMDDTVIALMIEKKGAIDGLEEILSVEGVDMVQFGPADYALSIGLPGQWSHPEVKDAQLKTIKKALENGIRPRVELRGKESQEQIQEYMDLGVRDFSLPSDVVIMYGWLKEHAGNLRETLSKI